MGNTNNVIGSRENPNLSCSFGLDGRGLLEFLGFPKVLSQTAVDIISGVASWTKRST